MWTVRTGFLLSTSLAFLACAVPKFPEPDSGTPITPPPEDTYVCEEQDSVLCASGTCEKICHKTNVQRQAAYEPCEKPVLIDGVRYDNCEKGSVCLEPAPDTAQGYFCFTLCKDSTSCNAGAACGERSLSESATLRVCDPNYQNCAGICCDPIDPSRNPCLYNKSCYLVPAPYTNRDTSWTVCEYSSGGVLPGKSCTWARDCVEGSTCIGGESGNKDSGTCRAVCDPSKEKPCGEGVTCKPYPKQWGYCQP